MSYKSRISAGIGLQVPISRKAFDDDYAMGFQQHLMGATLTITGTPNLTNVPFPLRAPGQVIFSKNDGAGKPALFVLDLGEDATDAQLNTDNHWTKYPLSGTAPLGGGLQQPAEWDATANTPSLNNTTPPDPNATDPAIPRTNFYIVQVAGTVQHDGATDTIYAVGDTAIYTENGEWVKLETSVNAVSGPVAWSNITGKPVIYGDGNGGTTQPGVSDIQGLNSELAGKLPVTATSTPQPSLDLKKNEIRKALDLGENVTGQAYYNKLAPYQYVLKLLKRYDAWLRGTSNDFASADANAPQNPDYFKGPLTNWAEQAKGIIDDSVTSTDAVSATKRTWSIAKILNTLKSYAKKLTDLTDVDTSNVQDGMRLIRQNGTFKFAHSGTLTNIYAINRTNISGDVKIRFTDGEGAAIETMPNPRLTSVYSESLIQLSGLKNAIQTSLEFDLAHLPVGFSVAIEMAETNNDTGFEVRALNNGLYIDDFSWIYGAEEIGQPFSPLRNNSSYGFTSLGFNRKRLLKIVVVEKDGAKMLCLRDSYATRVPINYANQQQAQQLDPLLMSPDHVLSVRRAYDFLLAQLSRSGISSTDNIARKDEIQSVDTTQFATTAYIDGRIGNLKDGVAAEGDTLKKLKALIDINASILGTKATPEQIAAAVNAIIDDTTPSANTTYSSNEINQRLATTPFAAAPRTGNYTVLGTDYGKRLEMTTTQAITTVTFNATTLANMPESTMVCIQHVAESSPDDLIDLVFDAVPFTGRNTRMPGLDSMVVVQKTGNRFILYGYLI